jgi:hypothetical protein
VFHNQSGVWRSWGVILPFVRIANSLFLELRKPPSNISSGAYEDGEDLIHDLGDLGIGDDGDCEDTTPSNTTLPTKMKKTKKRKKKATPPAETIKKYPVLSEIPKHMAVRPKIKGRQGPRWSTQER